MTPESIEQVVLDCLACNYGLGGSLTRLPGENLNYLLIEPSGQRQVVKIVDEHMPSEAVEMEFQAMEHALQKGLSMELPGIIKNLNGKIETRINIHINTENRLILFTFIGGENLDSYYDISRKLLSNVGKSLAEFDLALEDFDHPASHRDHRWNLANAGRHREKASLPDKPEYRELLTWGFEAWQTAKDALDDLPQQVIHGDANPENILVEGEEVRGLVDFGDMCFNPAICELAICLSYIMMGRGDPLENAAIVCRAYHQTKPLSGSEYAVLFPLICGRLAVSIAVSTARREIDPDNPNWFSGEPDAWRLLAAMRA